MAENPVLTEARKRGIISTGTTSTGVKSSAATQSGSANPVVQEYNGTKAQARAASQQRIIETAKQQPTTQQTAQTATASTTQTEDGGFDLGKFLIGSVAKGGNAIAKAGSSTLSFLERSLLEPLFPGITENTPIQDLNKGVDENAADLESTFGANRDKGGKAAKVAEDLIVGTVQAVPQAVAAVGTAGSSLAAQGLSGAAATSPTIVNTLKTAVSGMVKNPNYWTSFFSTLGNDYESARADGADDTRAGLYAVTDSLLNAAVEVGGGIQTLPTELQGNRFTVRKWIDSMLDEGKEEVVQGVISRGLENMVYNKGNELASVSDEDAILNPVTSAKEFGMGAAVGGILSGAQGLMSNAAQKAAGNATGTQTAVREGNITTKPQNAAEGAQTASQAGIMEQEAARLFGQNNAAPETGTAGSVKAGQVTTIKNPYRGEIPTQTARQSTAPVQVSNDSLTTAQNRIAGARGLESSIPGQSFKSSLKNAYKGVFKAAKGVPVEGMTFNGQPYTVDIPNSVPGKVISDNNLTAEKLALLDNLSDVVRNGEYVGSGEYVAHGAKTKNTVRYDYFETPVEINGKPYIASFDVEVFPNTNNYRTHKLNEIELSSTTSADTGRDPAANVGRTAQSEGTRTLNVDYNIAQGAENVKSQGLDGIGAANAGSAEAAARYDNLGSAKRGFTTAGMEGTEKTSRLADSMPYNQWQEAATGLTREDYSKIFRYESQSETKSLHLAEELLYLMKDGRKTFLRDVDEAAFHELVQSLDDATAWNGPQTDAARMIQTELQGKAVNAEIDETEYTDFLKIMQAHTTATGQGVQANAKWSRNDNSNGQSTELEALKRLENSKLSKEEQQAIFRQIVQWDMNIESVSPGDTASMKKIIMEVAQKRGVLGGWLGKVRTSWVNNALDSLTFDQLKQFAYSSTAAYTSDTTPANAGQKAKTVQVLNMLSSPVTAASNLTGNASFYGIDAVAMDVSTLLDMALSNVTGTRSIAKEHFPLGKSSLSAGAMAAKMSLAEIALDVDMGSERGRYGTGSNRTYKANGRGVFNTGQATDLFAERVLSSLERNQAYLLTAPDEFFKGMARSTAENTQKLVDSGKIKTENKAYAAEQAEQLAKYRTFQDQSIPAAWTQAFHDALNLIGVGDSGKQMYGLKVHSFGAGDFAEVFTRVAGNLVSRGVEYSPVNAAKGLVETVKLVADAAGGKAVDPAAQSKAVASLGRGATGSVLALGAVALAKAGLLRQADDENDEDVAALNQSEGITGTQLNLSAAERLLRGESAEWQYGDTLVDLSRIQPLNFILNLGTEIAKEDQNPLLSVFYGTMNAAASAGGELPMLQTVGNTAKDIIKYNKNPWEVLGEQFGKTLISSVTPNIISGIAKGTDDRPRNTYSGDGLTDILLDTAKSRIPGLRQTLPGSVNTMGEEKLYQGRDDGLLNVLLNPIGVNTYTQSDVSKEMQRVREETGETGFYPSKKIPSTLSGNGKTVELDYEERQDYQRDRGATTMIVTADLIGQSYYKGATAEKQAELLNDAYDYARMAATSNVLGTDAVAKWVGNTIAAQKSTGLTPATVIQYRDMLSEAKETKGSSAANSAVREKIKADSRLTTAQKNALDDIVLSDGIYIPKDLNVDYTSDETYTISQMSEGAQKRWDSIKSQFGMSAADYEQAWDIYQSNDLTASEKRSQISALGYNGAAVYKALGKKLS